MVGGSQGTHTHGANLHMGLFLVLQGKCSSLRNT